MWHAGVDKSQMWALKEERNKFDTRHWLGSIYKLIKVEKVESCVFLVTLYAAFILTRRLPLCSVNTACSSIVNTERCAAIVHCRAALLLSWIEVNCMQSAAVDIVAKVIDLLARCCLCLVIPKRQKEFAQLYKYHHQSSKQQVSLKAAQCFGCNRYFGSHVWKGLTVPPQ